ncbi:MAG: phosphate acyltransferase, partial [Candidatus Ratteibacteria bacterium]|nr:phosphate acyltransferase [Candidatus Ratteibacteria bacterium]
MKIAIDAMGGEFAPQAVVEGAIQAAEKSKAELVLVGDKKAIE